MSVETPYRSQLYIDGQWQAAADGEWREIHDPATGKVVGTTAFGGRVDADRALDAATRAFREWGRTPARERAQLLRAGAVLVRERRYEIGTALTLEQGKPLADSLKEIDFGADVFDYYAELILHRGEEWRPAASSDLRSLVVRQPIGVAVAMTPWNYPVDLLAWKVAPALAAGCSVICKPSPLTPLASALAIGCFADAGLPPGVLNYVVGPNDRLGELLVSDPRSQVIALTGSTGTGRRVMQLASARLKRLNLELGGQTPLIVLDDADLDATVPAAARRSFSNMGQICIAVNRIYVAHRLRDEFSERLTAVTSGLRIGHGLDPNVEYGPMINRDQVEHTQAHLDDALRRGARLLTGGRAPSGERYARGSFFLPTVLADVPDDARVMQEETFGPLAPITSFGSIEELIARVNNTDFGLAAYIFGRDLGVALQVAEQLEYGGVGINVNDITELHAPFGGWKQSGLGRELGPEGLDTYLESKHIRLRLPPLTPGEDHLR